MTSHQLVIAPAAKNDLKDIYQYGLRHWGQRRSKRYLSHLKNQFWMLTDQPLVGPECSDILQNIRSPTVESHTLFYRVTANKVEVIRVLHGRQDPNRYLK